MPFFNGDKMKANKTYIDSKQRRFTKGEKMPSDYDKTTIKHYENVGIIAPSVTKPAKPVQKKTLKLKK